MNLDKSFLLWWVCTIIPAIHGNDRLVYA